VNCVYLYVYWQQWRRLGVTSLLKDPCHFSN
jgi:hypothetical protein